jgi:hypothetical protein
VTRAVPVGQAHGKTPVPALPPDEASPLGATHRASVTRAIGGAGTSWGKIFVTPLLLQVNGNKITEVNESNLYSVSTVQIEKTRYRTIAATFTLLAEVSMKTPFLLSLSLSLRFRDLRADSPV